MAAEGELQPAQIDTLKYTAVVTLDESVDIRAVRFTEFEVTPGASADPDLLDGEYDMSLPMVVKVSRYQDYSWMISAQQTIERYLTDRRDCD